MKQSDSLANSRRVLVSYLNQGFSIFSNIIALLLHQVTPNFGEIWTQAKQICGDTIYHSIHKGLCTSKILAPDHFSSMP